jgi:hypothetical protein
MRARCESIGHSREPVTVWTLHWAHHIQESLDDPNAMNVVLDRITRTVMAWVCPRAITFAILAFWRPRFQLLKMTDNSARSKAMGWQHQQIGNRSEQAPWRQVHILLESAADRTSDLSAKGFQKDGQCSEHRGDNLARGCRFSRCGRRTTSPRRTPRSPKAEPPAQSSQPGESLGLG